MYASPKTLLGYRGGFTQTGLLCSAFHRPYFIENAEGIFDFEIRTLPMQHDPPRPVGILHWIQPLNAALTRHAASLTGTISVQDQLRVAFAARLDERNKLVPQHDVIDFQLCLAGGPWIQKDGIESMQNAPKRASAGRNK